MSEVSVVAQLDPVADSEVVVTPVPTPVPTHATTLELISPMVLNLKGSEMPIPATTLDVVSLMTLNVKGEEVPTLATTLEGPDSNVAACPTTTNTSTSRDSHARDVTRPTPRVALRRIRRRPSRNYSIYPPYNSNYLTENVSN